MEHMEMGLVLQTHLALSNFVLDDIGEVIVYLSNWFDGSFCRNACCD